MFSKKLISQAQKNPHLIYQASFERLQAHQTNSAHTTAMIDELLMLSSKPHIGSMALLTLTDIVSRNNSLIKPTHAQQIISGVLSQQHDPRLISARRDQMQALQSFQNNQPTIIKNFGSDILPIFNDVSSALVEYQESKKDIPLNGWHGVEGPADEPRLNSTRNFE
jgi:hypothetical protein